MYRLQSIRKRYGSNVALDIEELTIAEGRLYTLTGANGGGRSQSRTRRFGGSRCLKYTLPCDKEDSCHAHL